MPSVTMSNLRYDACFVGNNLSQEDTPQFLIIAQSACPIQIARAPHLHLSQNHKDLSPNHKDASCVSPTLACAFKKGVRMVTPQNRYDTERTGQEELRGNVLIIHCE